MVNLTIRLGKAGAGAGASPGGVKQEQAGGINSATTTKGPSIPPHLVDTDLPPLKGVGTVFSEPCAVNFVGVKARRRPGDKVHICVRCNFPIAVYGRLIPCEHVFCLTCVKLDPACFLCEERVTRIQKMDVLEGIYICGAPGCLRSFLARPDFDLHISEAHPQLLPLEQGRLLSPERNVSAGNNAVPVAQVQSHQSGQQQYAEQFVPPVRQPLGNPLQVILPKKEEPQQRRPPKVVRQDHPQGLLGRPVPELRLPDQFPHHRGGNQHSNHERGVSDANPQGRDPQKPRRRSEWDVTQMPENGREGMHEGERDLQRERLGDNHAERKKEKDGNKDKGPPPQPQPQPPLYPNPKDVPQKQKEGSLPPPPPYPPLTNFSSPVYLPQQDGKTSFSSPTPYPPPRGFHPGMPLVGSRHEGFGPHGYGHQNGPPRPMNGTTNNNNALDHQFGHNTRPRPHFYPEYGPPSMGMPPRGAPRYHEGHLPPPPPGPPPPKRTKFNGQGEPIMDYNQWGNPGNPGNFGGHPGSHAYPNWMPPANS